MLRCPNCQQQQNTGKFCGNCGTALENMEQETNSNQEEVKIETNENVLDALPEETITKESAAIPVKEEKEASEINRETAGKQAKETSINTDEVEKMHHQVKGEVSATYVAPTPDVTVTPTEGEEDSGIKEYWQYSLSILKRPDIALRHQQDKFMYGLINLGLYAFTFTLIIYFIARRQYQATFIGEVGNAFGVDASGALFQMSIYVLVGMVVFLAIAVGCLYAAERMIIKQMNVKEIVVQYSGLLIPLTFLHVAIILFSFVGSTFITFILVGLSLTYAFFFLIGLYMYAKVIYYQSTTNKVYTVVGTTLFVLFVYSIVMFIVGMSVIESITEMIDPYSSNDNFYGF